MADLKIFSAGVAMRIAKKAVEAFQAEYPDLEVEFSGGGSLRGGSFCGLGCHGLIGSGCFSTVLA